MSCLLSSGYSSTCETFSKAGGLDSRLWILNLVDASGIKLGYTETVTNVIDVITVQSGSQAFAVKSAPESHNVVTSSQKPGINQYFGQVVNMRLITDTAADLTFTNDLVKANKVVFIVETLSKQFKLYGQNNGMKNIPADISDSGQTKDSDLSQTYSFEGGEPESEFKFVDVGGYEATLAYLIGLETPAA
tara:strand:+ start:171 stop:740 length:570 start_codon:yes stop_codon:yes gene_type:complete